MSAQPAMAARQHPAGLCPRCSAPFDEEQEYCLECGLRLPWDSPVFARLTARASGRYPWLPRDWLWPALAALVVAVGGGALAIVLTRDDGPRAAAISTALGGNPPATDAEALPTPPEATGKGSTSPPPASARARLGKRDLVTWPQDRNGWTIVLVSLDQRNGLPAAREKAREAIDRGLRNVGIIDSSHFASLHPGYYVIFTGIYDSAEEAVGALRRAKAVFQAAYTRQIAV